MKLNSNIPSFKGFVKKSYFTKNIEDDKEFYNVYVFGIQSCGGQILTFHVMTDNGMLRSRVPLSEIYTKIPTNDIPFNFKQLWDCFSENVSVIEYDFLAFHRAQIVLRDGSKYKLKYSLKNRQNFAFNPDSVAKKVLFTDSKILQGETEFRYIATLKRLHAQRIANEFSAYISRIGLNESEYIRRNSPRTLAGKI